MSEPMNDLQQLWRKPEALSEREVKLVTRLIQEKGTAFRDTVKARNHAAILLGLTIAFFLLLTARTARWPWVGPGFALIGASSLAAALVTWIYQRRHPAPDSSLEMRRYCEQLLRYYDVQTRLVRITKYWCAPLFCAGVALLGWGFWRHTGSVIELILFGVLAPLWSWVSFDLYGGRSAGELQEQKSRIALLLAEIGEGGQA